MRTISISTEVFSMIWAARRPPEETENEILIRILQAEGPLSVSAIPIAPTPIDGAIEVKTSKQEYLANRVNMMEEPIFGKVRWVDDVKSALVTLGGRASLHMIYQQVERVRREAGRSVPKTIEAVIRRTLEDHSSDSANFRGADLFCLPEGHGAGVWALRR